MPYCHLWPVRLYIFFFPTFSYKRHDFRKKLLNIKVCCDSLYNFVRKISNSKKKLVRCAQTCVLFFCKVRTLYSCQILINTLRTESFKLFKRPFPGFFLNFNTLNAELNPICYLLALLAHHFLHISSVRVKSLTLRLLMSYIYIYIYMTLVA